MLQLVPDSATRKARGRKIFILYGLSKTTYGDMMPQRFVHLRLIINACKPTSYDSVCYSVNFYESSYLIPNHL